MVSPPRPMMRPTMPGGHSTVSDTSPAPGPLASLMRLLICATAEATCSGAVPVTVTCFRSPGVVWSICERQQRLAVSIMIHLQGEPVQELDLLVRAVQVHKVMQFSKNA